MMTAPVTSSVQPSILCSNSGFGISLLLSIFNLKFTIKVTFQMGVFLKVSFKVVCQFSETATTGGFSCFGGKLSLLFTRNHETSTHTINLWSPKSRMLCVRPDIMLKSHLRELRRAKGEHKQREHKKNFRESMKESLQGISGGNLKEGLRVLKRKP